jgi:tetratricopeptide (TPR) repeat protein
VGLRRAFSVIVVGLGWVVVAPSASAQEADAQAAPEDSARDVEARALFEAGRAAFLDGRHEDALQSFQRAYELSGRPVLLFNIAASLDRLRRNEEALELFGRYLTEVPDAENRAEVEGRMRALRTAIDEDRAREARERELEAALQSERENDPTVFETWWFWTIAGVLIAGGAAIAIGYALYDPGVEGPLLGTTGQVGEVLTWGGL